MDKAEPEDKKLSGDDAERRHDAGVGGDVLLPAIGVYQVPGQLQGVGILPACAGAGGVDGQAVAAGFAAPQYAAATPFQAERQAIGTSILTGQL